MLVRALELLDVETEFPTTLAVVAPPPPIDVPPTARTVPPTTGEGDEVGVVAIYVQQKLSSTD